MVIAPGRETVCELRVGLVRRRVLFLGEASGLPLASVEIEAGNDGSGWRRWRRVETTDEAGCLELLLPRGEVGFRVVGDRGAGAPDRVAVEWGEGEDVIEVRLRGSER